jgi:uncharacterized peroxidase-related enzyme
MTTIEYRLLAKLATPAQSTLHTNIPVVEESAATGELAAVYQAFRDGFGRDDVPGILKCFGSSPLLLTQIMAMSSTLLFSEGALGRRRKEMIASYVSTLNECPYCADSHAFFLSAHGGATAVDPILNNSIEASGICSEEKLLLEFAAKVNGASSKIGIDDVETLRSAGWTDDQIAEAVHLAAGFALFNRVANAFGLTSQGLLGLRPSTAAEPLA